MNNITVSLETARNEWRKIEGYENYFVSREGQVKRVYENRGGNCRDERVLKPSYTRGYAHVCLSKNNKQKNYRIARLVAETFIPNPEGKREVNHIDGNKGNDHVSNLEWCTPSENTRHAVATGLRKRVQGIAAKYGVEPHNKGKKRVRHEKEYDPSGAFCMCLRCGAENPFDEYCTPHCYE